MILPISSIFYPFFGQDCLKELILILYQNRPDKMGGSAKHPSPEGACRLSAIRVDETEMFAFDLLKPF